MKVYRYGLLSPSENAGVVAQQMRAAHEYRNDLVRIERERRAVLRELAAQAGAADAEAEVRAAEAAIVEAVQAAKAHRAASRSRSVPPELTAQISRARAVKKDATERLRAVRAELKVSLSATQDEIEERVAEVRRGARALTTAYWGSYLLVEAADAQMRKMPLYDGAEPNDPRFVRWEGEGRIGVQLQGGLSVESALAGRDTRLRIETRGAPPGTDPTSKRSAKRRYSDLVMRVGTAADGRSPVWARFPMVMHRPMPSGGQIKWAVVNLRKIGPREEWYVTITVDEGETAARGHVTRDGAGESVVGVDIGWRQTEDGTLRAGAWRGSDGRGDLVIVPNRFLGGMGKVRDLEEIRDRSFNAARDALAKWLSGAVEAGTVATWLTEATATLGQWRSQGRLAALARRWRDNRFPGDEDGYGPLEAWRYHDHHLWEWECSQRTKSLRFRREGYRILAAQLAREYQFLAIEKFDLREMARIATLEDDRGKAGEPQQRRNRTLAATSELRGALVLAFGGKAGGRVVEHGAAYTTSTCHACTSAEAWDQAKEIEHTCSSCGAHWDQDDNAARNLLRLTTELPGGDGKEVAPAEESRWTKAKRMRAEKDARMAERTAAE